MDVDAWKPADGLTLEPGARKAVTDHENCLAVIAGPGAGKTEVLAQRADFLLRTGCCRYPKRILAISFKVDASKNLKERVMKRCGRELASRFDSHTFHAFAKRIIDRFRPVLTGLDALNAGYTIGDARILRNQITFKELVPFAVQILEQSNIARNAVRQTYSDVFLDEFQDCTTEQYKLIKIAFAGTRIRLVAVGDTKQRIMMWAGALDGVFKQFATDFAAVHLRMYRNFRSQPRLLRLQNEIIRVLDPDSVMPDELMVGEGGEVHTLHFNDSQEEARCMADLIEEWSGTEGIPFSEIAVLISKQPDLYARHLMSELEIRGVPYRNEQHMQDISTEPAAKLIVDYVSCLYDCRESKAWIRLMNQLAPFADDEGQSSFHQDFQQFFKPKRAEVAHARSMEEPFIGWKKHVDAFLQWIDRKTLTALSPDYETRARLDQVVADTVRRIEEILMIEPNLPKALKRFSEEHAVRILTIHKSKGLEFDSTIIMAVENESFFGNVDEERCAFFVGVSRAKRRLILTYTARRERPHGHSGPWRIDRTKHAEYFGYVEP